MSKELSRRDFLRSGTAAAIGMTAVPGIMLNAAPVDKKTETPVAAPAPKKGTPSPLSSLPIKDQTENKIRQARFVAYAPKTASLGILHFSDIHGDQVAADRINAYISEYRPYIDAAIHTGDAVHYYAERTPEYPGDAQWWRNSGLADKTLFVLGNHDGSMGSNAKGHQEASADWDFMGKEWDFDTYFADYAEQLGCVLPEGYNKKKSPYYKSCFWHKDFPEAKIRLIGLDGMHFNDKVRYLTDEQEQWFAKRLDETLDPASPVYGYSVITACHYPIDNFDGDNEQWDEARHRFVYNTSPNGGRVMNERTGAISNFSMYARDNYLADKRFSMRDRVPNATEKYGYVSGDANPLADILQQWVDKGGKFIVWLCGHCHTDMLFYSARYPNLLCLSIDQAGNLRGNSITDRPEEADNRVCANFYGVDTQNGLFKVVRLGTSLDRFMVPKDVLCYDYLNKKVIFE